MVESGDRERLAATFDGAADLYQRVRPEYPSELYDRLVAVTGLSQGASLLEVGAASGKATIPLARPGFHVTCLEPGVALAAVARSNLAAFDIEVVEVRFEDWTPTVVGRSTWCTRRRRGTGSIIRSGTRRRQLRCGVTATWRCGKPGT